MIACRGGREPAGAGYVPVSEPGQLRRAARVLVGDLGLKPGDDLQVVVAASIRIGVVMEARREKAVARMRARGLRFPAGCAFDRDEADA